MPNQSCLCYRKGNEFWANHNARTCQKMSELVVFVTAKVMNFEQITTAVLLSNCSCRCLCYRKGNEFWANHNLIHEYVSCVNVVFVTAKVMNFEQITTNLAVLATHRSCLCYRKGNEFWANHNFRGLFLLFQGVVFVTAKVMNFEQITTTKVVLAFKLCCLCYRKGNEFWANHNTFYWSQISQKLSLLPQR